ncbi:low molecular weight phosphatase family protein [Reinekea sp. G2M2-21]|uniref:arsenate-mycothiol transferase ArsC n=1 Tax=Reinekea sp. G2M2-21 TaxID=2788942 RepID=UPI0018A89C3D|nr:hypothetical protein [Reinekea sp. G2M2-21]
MSIDYLRSEYGGQKYFLITAYYILLKRFLPSFLPGDRDIKRKPNRVVFVCKGNICRSAFAHQYLLSKGFHNVASFGLCTKTGLPIEPNIGGIAKGLGIETDQHVSTSHIDFVPESGDLFVCMEPKQVAQIRSVLGDVSVVLLGNFLIDKRPYLTDPYATNAKYMRRSLELIMQSVDRLYSDEIS